MKLEIGKRLGGFALTLLILAGGGCGSYEWLRASRGTLEVQAFENLTAEPGLTADVMASLRRRAQQEGGYSLATLGEGDILLFGVLDELVRRPISFASNDLEVGRDFRLRLRARVTAVDRRTGELALDDREVTAEATVQSQRNLALAERDVFPILAEELARKTVSLLSDGAW